jgi:hypothetical protein
MFRVFVGEGGELSLGFDLYPLLLTIENKKQYYAQAILENWLTVFTHDPAIP